MTALKASAGNRTLALRPLLLGLGHVPPQNAGTRSAPSGRALLHSPIYAAEASPLNPLAQGSRAPRPRASRQRSSVYGSAAASAGDRIVFQAPVGMRWFADG